MDLVLWRHAEAYDLQAGEDDLERRLTPRGQTQAKRVGRWLRHTLPSDALVLSSPARRCRHTAHVLDWPVEIDERLAPGARPADLIEVADWPRSARTVLIVGHQPTLGATAALLMAGTAQEWSMRRGAVAWLRRREREGRAEVVLRAWLAPEELLP